MADFRAIRAVGEALMGHFSYHADVPADGRQTYPRLPLELHFLITVWGGEASYQYELPGWIFASDTLEGIMSWWLIDKKLVQNWR